MESQSEEIDQNQSAVSHVNPVNISQSEEIPTQHESVVFHTEATLTGRNIHSASHSTLFYNRRDVLKSGRSYFVCSENECNARLYAQYTSKEASYTEELPKLSSYVLLYNV